MQYDSENPLFWIPLFFPPENLGEVSDKHGVRFHQTFWLWKSSTKASGPQASWQTITGYWSGMYLKAITGECHKPLHFRGKFLPVSLVRTVLFCTNIVLGTLKLCLIEKFCIHIWIQHIKYCWVHLLKFVGRKKFKFCCPVQLVTGFNTAYLPSCSTAYHIFSMCGGRGECGSSYWTFSVFQ